MVRRSRLMSGLNRPKLAVLYWIQWEKHKRRGGPRGVIKERVIGPSLSPALVTVAGGVWASSHDTIAELDDAGGVTGNVTVKVEPFPKALLASMDPPRISVNCLTI